MPPAPFASVLLEALNEDFPRQPAVYSGIGLKPGTIDTNRAILDFAPRDWYWPLQSAKRTGESRIGNPLALPSITTTVYI